MCGTYRYDIRNRLEDKSQFGLKPILPRRRTDEEDDLEEQLDQERYLALGVDILEHELLEGKTCSLRIKIYHLSNIMSTEETKKRAQERSGSYQAVGFSYEKVSTQDSRMTSVPPAPQRLEHPPTSSVDVAESEEDVFVLPEGLVVPGHIRKVGYVCSSRWSRDVHH